MERVLLECREWLRSLVVHLRGYRGHAYLQRRMSAHLTASSFRAAHHKHRRSSEGRDEHRGAERQRRARRRERMGGAFKGSGASGSRSAEAKRRALKLVKRLKRIREDVNDLDD